MVRRGASAQEVGGLAAIRGLGGCERQGVGERSRRTVYPGVRVASGTEEEEESCR